MSTIEITCTSCGKATSTGEANAGKQTRCVQCGTFFEIPAIVASETEARQDLFVGLAPPRVGFVPKPGFVPTTSQLTKHSDLYSVPTAVSVYDEAAGKGVTPGIISLVCGIASLAITILGSFVSIVISLLLPPLLPFLIVIVLTISMSISIFSTVLGIWAQPRGLKISGIVINLVNLVLAVAIVVLMLLLVVFGVGLYWLATEAAVAG